MNQATLRRWLSAAALLVLSASLAWSAGGAETDGPAATATAETGDWQSPTPDSGGLALPISREVTTYRYMMAEHPSIPLKDTFIVFPELEKRTNVRIELMPIPNDGYDQKVAVVMASGDLPDMIYFRGNYEPINAYGPRGMFLNILDYAAGMPNFDVVAERIPEVLNYRTSPDELYAVPIQFNPKGPNSLPNRIFMIRTDLLDAHGLAMPQNYDELFAALAELKRLYPESTPWANRNGLNNILDVMMVSWGFQTTSGNTFTYPVNGQWRMAVLEDGFKEMIEFLNRSYEAGILDREFALTSVGQWEEKMVNGSAFFTLDWNNRSGQFTTTARQAGNTEFFLSAMPAPASGMPGAARDVMGRTHVGQFMALNAAAESPEILTSFVDYWLYSEAGSLLTWRGIDGEHTILDRESKLTIDHPNIRSNSYPDAELRATDDFGIRYNGAMGVNVEFFGWATPDPDVLPDYTVARRQYYGGKGVAPPPVVLLNEEEREIETDLKIDIVDFTDIELTRFVMGDRPLSEWDAFTRQLIEKGADELVELYQGAWDRAN